MKTLHIVNPFHNPYGGSEQRALDLYKQLKNHADVNLWSDGGAADCFTSRFPIRSVDLQRGVHPLGGTLIIVGAYFQAEVMFHLARPERLIYLYNTPSPNLFRKRLQLARQRTGIEPEIVYASEGGAKEIGLPGRVEPSPIDLERFHPDKRQAALAGVGRGVGGGVVGRHSRDVPEKHHPDDFTVYREAMAQGWSVRLMGGTCLAGAMGEALYGRIESLECGAQPAEDFLAGLDCFFYRVSDDWTEAFGRVVLEAMASGLPVICDGKVGAAKLITTGEDGFVTTTTAEVLTALDTLAGDPTLRRRIGAAARRKAEVTYSDVFAQELVDYYTA